MSIEQDNTNKQMKRLVIGISALLLISVVLLYSLGVFRLPNSKIDGFEAIPQNTAAILAFKNYGAITEKLSEMEYMTSISKLNLVKKFQKEIDLLDSLATEQEDIKKALNNSRFLVSLHSGSAKRLDFLYLFDNIPPSFDLEEFLNGAAVDKVTKDKRASYNLFEVAITKNETFFVCFYKGLLLVGRHAFLIEYAIEQLQDPASNIKNQADFKKTMEYTGNNGDLAVYLNFRTLPSVLSAFGNTEKSASIEALQYFATWIGLDILFQEKNFVINGYTHPALENKLLKSLGTQELPDNNLIADVLPDNTAILAYIGVKEEKKFYRDLSIEKTRDFREYIHPWIGKEVAYAVTEPRGEDFKEDQFAVIHATDIEEAERLLTKFGEKVGNLKAEQYHNYTIKRIMMADVLKSVFGKELNPIQNPYYTIIEDHVVFCNSNIALRNWIDKYFFGQTLGRDANYLQFKEGLSPTTNMFFYLNTSSLLPVMHAYTDDAMTNDVRDAFGVLAQLAPIGIQLTANNNKFFTNAVVNYSKHGRQVSSILWRTTLDTTAAIPPAVVTNHITEEKEIFVQDKNHSIYLLNRNGEPLWKQQVDSTIISKIYQIDYYGNGFLQYMFNTATRIYAIDRNGKSIEGFPRNIQGKAANGLMVVDYLKSKNYRYFYATTDGKIYGFDKEGNGLDGWNPKSDIGLVQYPIQHFVYNDLDYIVALNTEGKLHIFKRNGEIRLDSIQFQGKFLSTFGYDTYRFPRVVATDSRGKANVMSFSGKTFKLSMNIGDNKNVKFSFVDIVGDERKDYAVLSEKDLGVFYYEGADFGRFYRHTFEETQEQLFTIRTKNSDKTKLGTISKDNRRIYLLDENGFLYPDFPLAGTTLFRVTDLYDDDKNILIVANGDVVYTYKLKEI